MAMFTLPGRKANKTCTAEEQEPGHNPPSPERGYAANTTGAGISATNSDPSTAYDHANELGQSQDQSQPVALKRDIQSALQALVKAQEESLQATRQLLQLYSA